MTTARDLFIIATDPTSKDSVGQGDLSLALAGAELLDLVDTGVLTVSADRIEPRDPFQPPDDRLLADAAATLVREAPFEQVEDWLWRRGRDLSAAYRSALEKDGELTWKRSGLLSFGTGRLEQADTPARRRATGRRQEGEPVLAALASAVGIGGEVPDEEPGFDDETVIAVVAAVRGAVMELEAVRQRRSIEKAAYANIWRAP